MSQHYAVVHLDMERMRQIAQHRQLTRQDALDSYALTIECENPDDCDGWVECQEEGHPHPDDIDEMEGFFHGEYHEYIEGLWMTEYDGCVVEANQSECEWPDNIPRNRAGRYLLDIDWGDYGEGPPYLKMVKEVGLL